jgi:hypothetical protein
MFERLPSLFRPALYALRGGFLVRPLEFGIIQIVDIALRAMSPAVNDPSTAISCIESGAIAA